MKHEEFEQMVARAAEILQQKAGESPDLHCVGKGCALGTNLDPFPKFTTRQAEALKERLMLPADPVHVGGNLWALFAPVTPLLAAFWLQHFNSGNRDPVLGAVRALIRALESGEYRPNPQPISFRADGRLQDGQHRLAAILLSGKPAYLLIVLNVSDEVKQVLDQQVRRSARQLLEILGGSMTAHQEGVVRRAMFGPHPVPRLHSLEVVDYVAANMGAFEWLFRRFDKTVRAVTIAPVEAAVYRAYVCVGRAQRPRLGQFAEYLVDGYFEGFKPATDNAVFRLRDWLAGGAAERRSCPARRLYLVTAAALRHFLDEEAPGKLRPADEDPFALENPIATGEGEEAE